MRHSKLVRGFHVKTEGWSFIVVISKEFSHFSLRLEEIFVGVFEMAKAFFAQYAVKSFNEGLLIFSIWPGGSYCCNTCSRFYLPVSFKLRSSVALYTINFS